MVTTLPAAFLQIYCGLGFPLAWHAIEAVSPAVIFHVAFFGLIISGGPGQQK